MVVGWSITNITVNYSVINVIQTSTSNIVWKTILLYYLYIHWKLETIQSQMIEKMFVSSGCFTNKYHSSEMYCYLLLLHMISILMLSIYKIMSHIQVVLQMGHIFVFSHTSLHLHCPKNHCSLKSTTAQAWV